MTTKRRVPCGVLPFRRGEVRPPENASIVGADHVSALFCSLECRDKACLVRRILNHRLHGFTQITIFGTELTDITDATVPYFKSTVVLRVFSAIRALFGEARNARISRNNTVYFLHPIVGADHCVCPFCGSECRDKACLVRRI